jgi:Tol biopolymer transport system component
LSLGVLAACGSSPPPPPAIRVAVPVPEDRVLSSFAASADGARIAYSAESIADGRRHIYVVETSDPTAERELPATIGASSPFFSPDGASLAYFSRGAIWRVAVAGDREPVRVADAPVESAGGTWTADDRIVFAPLGTSGLIAVPAGGGGATALTEVNAADGELEHGWPHALSDGSTVFTVSERGRDAHIEVLSPEKQRTRTACADRWTRSVRANRPPGLQLPRQFDGGQVQSRRTRHRRCADGGGKGDADIRRIRRAGAIGVLVSRTGTLVWLRAGAQEGGSRLVRVERDGKVSSLSAPPDVLQTPRLSPDGRRLAVVVRSGIMTREIRVLDAARPDRIISTIQGGDNQSPAWMDNRRLTFGSNRDGLQKIYVVSVDGKRPPAPLFTANATAARNPASWSRPPRLLGLYEIEPARGRDVLVYRIGESISPVAATGANERSPAVSADGRWISYVSDGSGRDEVYVAPLESRGRSDAADTRRGDRAGLDSGRAGVSAG